MPQIRISAAVLALFVLSGFNYVCPQAKPSMQAVTPEALIRDLYKVHAEDFKANRDRILDGKSRRYLDKYFDKDLAALIWKDLTTHTDEVGVIDFDLFYNAQDAQIRDLLIGKASISGSSATVPVSFSNFGRKERLVYKLIKQNGQWKIADIDYGGGFTLLRYFQEAS